jgi:hypothetical protein
MATATEQTAALEYKNDFFAIKITELKYRSGTYNYSIGLNLPKFNPIIWGRTGICSNAAFKGLQQLRADVSHYAHEKGIAVMDAGIPCTNICTHVDGWFQESDLIIENASPEAIRDILTFSARDLVQTILTAAHHDVQVAAGLDSAESQRLLESLSVANYREAAPPPIAKPQAAA